MKFSVFQLSRKGGREKNEDRMGYSYTKEACLFVVADGMGGHPEGEVAAQLALQTVSLDFQRLARPKLDDPAEFLENSLLSAREACDRLAEVCRAEPVQVIGSKFVLYKRNEQKPKIELVKKARK